MAAARGEGGPAARGECILEPLSLPGSPASPDGVAAVESSPSVPCIFCEECYVLAEQNQLLKHMIIEHKLVIADVKLVADFKRYISYWKKRFAEQPVTDFCSVIRTNSEAPLGVKSHCIQGVADYIPQMFKTAATSHALPTLPDLLTEEQDNYFLLCDVLPEDRLLREQLQQKRLREILEQQQRERYDTSFHSMCMFCDQEFTGNRSVLLNHMAREHAFNIGLPDNIVNCYEFLAVLQEKLDKVYSRTEGEGQSMYMLIQKRVNLRWLKKLKRELLREKNFDSKDQQTMNLGSLARYFCKKEKEIRRTEMAVGIPNLQSLAYQRTCSHDRYSLQCLYCEKVFRDKNTLKDHMRKKQHRRINAKNKEYDRFYIINYLVLTELEWELCNDANDSKGIGVTSTVDLEIFFQYCEFGKSWEEVQSEDDRELLDNLEEDWSDWEEHPVCAVCLFCEQQADTTEKLHLHMQKSHGFDFLKIKSELGLNFYQQVKLVNFIRREIHHCRCYSCQEKFQSKGGLISHMEETKHITFLPVRSTWDQPQYYFPTYENDTLLCTLSDSEDLIPEDQSGDVPVVSEDISSLKALKQSSVLNQLLCEENGSHDKS